MNDFKITIPKSKFFILALLLLTVTSTVSAQDSTPPSYKNFDDNISGLMPANQPLNIWAEWKDDGSGLAETKLAVNSSGQYQNVSTSSFGEFPYSGTNNDVSSQIGSRTLEDIYFDGSSYWVLSISLNNDDYIHKYDSTWSYTGTSYNIGSEIPDSELTKSIYKGDDGNWHVSDGLGSEVHEFDSSWNRLSSIDVSNQAVNPRGIYQDASGAWWVLDGDSERVYKYDSSWSYSGTYYDLHFGVATPSDLSKGDDGHWWILDAGSVHKYKTSWTFGGSYTGTSYGLQGSDNRGLTKDGDGGWWVAEDDSSSAYQYTNQGVYLNQSFTYEPTKDGTLGIKMWQADEEDNWAVTNVNTQEVDGSGPNWYNLSVGPNKTQPGTDVDINSTWLDNGTGLSKAYLSLNHGSGWKNYTETPVLEKEGFEDGNISSEWGGDTSNLSATSSNVITGNYSGKLNATGGGQSIVLRTLNDTTGGVKVLSLDMRVDTDTNNENNVIEMIVYDDDGGSTDIGPWIQFDDRDQTVNPVSGGFVGTSDVPWEVGEKIDIKFRYDFDRGTYRTYIDDRLLIGSELGQVDEITSIQFINTMDGADSSTVRNIYIDDIQITNRTYGSPWLFDSSNYYQDVGFNYKNSSFAGRLNYEVWGVDAGGNYNSTGVGEIRFLQTFNESYSQQIDVSHQPIQLRELMQSYSSQVNAEEVSDIKSDVDRNDKQGIQVIGSKDVNTKLNIEPVQNINPQQAVGEFIEYVTGSIANINIADTQSESPKPTIRTITTYNKDYTEQDRIESEEIHVRAEVTHPLGRSNLDIAEIDVINPNGNTVVSGSTMNHTSNISNGKIYEFNYTLPTVGSAGNWTLNITSTDTKGGATEAKSHFIYQNVDKSKGVPEQESVNIFNDVPYTNSFTITNPSNTEFVDALVNVSISSDTVLSTVILEKPDGTDVPIKTLSDSYFTYEADSVPSQSSLDYTLAYSVEGPGIQKSNVSYLQDNKNIQDIRYNLTTQGPTDFQDLTHSFKINNPQRVTSSSLFVNGTEVSLEGEYNFDTVDTDGEGVGDTIEFTVPELKGRSDYLVRLIRGEPLQIETGNSVLNEPVTENKIIEWRKGLRFYNPNPFSFTTQYKVRLPLRSSSIQVSGDFVSKSFDNSGAYVPLQLDFDPSENITRYVRFTTPSIDINQITNQPEIYWVNKQNEKTINVTFENPYSLTVTDAEDSVGILEGSDLTVQDEDGNVVAEEELVEGNYVVNTSKIPPQSTKTLNIDFNVPVANSTFIGNSNTSSGTRISAWDISSESPISRQPVRFTIDKFNCVEAKRAFVVGTNQTLDLICDGDKTVVGVGNLGPNEEFKLGVEWRNYHPVFNDVRIFYQTIGSNLFLIGLSLLSLIVVVGAIYQYIYGISIGGLSDLREILQVSKQKVRGLIQ